MGSGKFRAPQKSGFASGFSLIHFQPMAMKVQGFSGESSENFITCPSKMLCFSQDDQLGGSFWKQRISIIFRIGKAACGLGTVSDKEASEKIYYLWFFS